MCLTSRNRSDLAQPSVHVARRQKPNEYEAWSIATTKDICIHRVLRAASDLLGHIQYPLRLFHAICQQYPPKPVLSKAPYTGADEEPTKSEASSRGILQRPRHFRLRRHFHNFYPLDGVVQSVHVNWAINRSPRPRRQRCVVRTLSFDARRPVNLPEEVRNKSLLPETLQTAAQTFTGKE